MKSSARNSFNGLVAQIILATLVTACCTYASGVATNTEFSMDAVATVDMRSPHIGRKVLQLGTVLVHLTEEAATAGTASAARAGESATSTMAPAFTPAELAPANVDSIFPPETFTPLASAPLAGVDLPLGPTLAPTPSKVPSSGLAPPPTDQTAFGSVPPRSDEPQAPVPAGTPSDEPAVAPVEEQAPASSEQPASGSTQESSEDSAANGKWMSCISCLASCTATHQQFNISSCQSKAITTIIECPCTAGSSSSSSSTSGSNNIGSTSSTSGSSSSGTRSSWSSASSTAADGLRSLLRTTILFSVLTTIMLPLLGL